MEVKKEKLNELRRLCVSNAEELLQAAVYLSETEQKHIALGVAELALEELGKGFHCLAYCSDLGRPHDWEIFWSVWKNHQTKAHRAFLYEFFCTWRIELEESPDYFPSKRTKMPIEKEISFYVDYDRKTEKVTVPKNAIDVEEVANRLASVFGPMNAASNVEKLMDSKTGNYNEAFADWAWVVMTKSFSQQEAILELNKLSENKTEEYLRAVGDIRRLFEPDRDA